MQKNSHWSHFEDINVWIFDLDNTLYPAHCNLFSQIDKKMGEFVSNYLQIEHDEAKTLQKKYFKEYGTTLNGLMICHDLDPEEYLHFVHDIDVSQLARAEQLSQAIDQLEGRKIIFTNGSEAHANNVAGQLGIDHHFDHIFDIKSANYIPKPDISIYEKLVRELNIVPEQAVLFEDMAKNLKPAHDLGMTTVWIPNDEHWSHETSEGDHIHHVADDLSDWLHALLGSKTKAS